MNRPTLLDDALSALLQANRLGWGAYVAIGLRHKGLRRYQRGGEADILALPALFVDVDDTSPDALRRLRSLQPTPSCITFTGGGYHAFWWLYEPLTDMTLGRRILRSLRRVSGGDVLSVANSLRLVGTRNTKPARDNALCRIVALHENYHPVAAFTQMLPCQTQITVHPQSPHRPISRQSSNRLNPRLIQMVADTLQQIGYVQRGDWLTGSCLYPSRHRHDDTHPSFGFNTRSGYGNCYVCGSILLKDICITLGIQPADYGRLYL